MTQIPFPGVEIRCVLLALESDPRGNTYEWCKGLPGKQVSVYTRHKGVIFGNHYHTGKDPSKNPERFFLIQGKIRLTVWKHGQSEKFTTKLGDGTELLLYPYIWHVMEALTDVIFIEYRSKEFDREKPDTFTE